MIIYCYEWLLLLLLLPVWNSIHTRLQEMKNNTLCRFASFEIQLCITDVWLCCAVCTHSHMTVAAYGFEFQKWNTKNVNNNLIKSILAWHRNENRKIHMCVCVNHHTIIYNIIAMMLVSIQLSIQLYSSTSTYWKRFFFFSIFFTSSLSSSISLLKVIQL